MSKLPFVSWNTDVATEAIKVLNEAARKLQHAAEERERSAKQAAAEWQGPYSQEFDAHYQRAVREEFDLAETYSRRAKLVEQLDNEARSLNDRRKEEKQRADRLRGPS